MKIINHPKTDKLLRNYLSKPAHALILVAPEGSGKYFTSKWLAISLALNQITIEPELEKNITIDQIRSLYDTTKTGSKLVVIIKDAQKMGHEAQNALLKLLEEPPKNTLFILTTTNLSYLLPTIKSRSQIIQLLTPNSEEIKLHFEDKMNSELIHLDTLLLTNHGRIGLVDTLLNNPELLADHLKIVENAKNFYSSNNYERYLEVIKYEFHRDWILNLLSILAVLVQTLLKQNINNQKNLLKLTYQSNLIEETATNISNTSFNPKIHITRLIENL